MSEPSVPALPHEVHVLLCHRDVGIGRLCLGSLSRHSVEPVRFVVHDDGTLSDADLELLAGDLAVTRWWRRPAADRAMDEALARFPGLRAFRRTNPLALKILDLLVLGDDDPVFYCDSDVLFVADFRGLFSQLDGADLLVMRDAHNAYSVRSWQVLREPRLRLAARVNTGIIHARRALLDLELLEWFCSRHEHQWTPVWTEQTAWALLAARAATRQLVAGQFAIPERRRDLRGALAYHFVGPTRHLLAEAVRQPAWRGPAETVRSGRVRRCHAFELFTSELARRARRLV